MLFVTPIVPRMDENAAANDCIIDDSIIEESTLEEQCENLAVQIHKYIIFFFSFKSLILIVKLFRSISSHCSTLLLSYF